VRSLVFSPVVWPVLGGLSTVVHELGQAAGRAGDSTLLVTATGSIGQEGEDVYATKLCIPRQRSGGGPVGVARRVLLRARAPFALRRIIKRAGPFDLVHGHFPQPHFSLLSRLGLPLVLTYHGSDVLRLQDAGARPRLLRLHRNAAVLVGVSEFLCDELRRLDPEHAEKVVCIRNGRPRIAEVTMTRRHPETNDLRILFVGDLIRVKGVDLIGPALSRLRDTGHFQLDIVGEGDMRATIEESLQASCDSEEVRFHGALPSADVFERMRAADVLVLPSRREGLPNVLLEAMANGCAIVASRAGGIPEVVAHGENGLLFDPGDIRGFSEAIRALAGSVALRRSLVNRGFEFIKRYPDWDQVYAKYRDVYNLLLHDNPCPNAGNSVKHGL
jgi:glycosyltransferase involved in cell wall biosynthesis